MESIESMSLTGGLELMKAILLYGRNSYNSSESGVLHATVHNYAPGTDELLPGVTLTEETLAKALTGLGKGADFKSWAYVEADVIASGMDLKAWWTPAKSVHLWFAEESGLKSGQCAQPALFWVRKRESLCLFALASDERPSENTELYSCPHYNVYSNGNVCLGSTAKTPLEDHRATEAAYWASAFVHRHNENAWKQTIYPKGLKALWTRLLKEKGSRPFPVEYLEPAKKTVGEVLAKQGAFQ